MHSKTLFRLSYRTRFHGFMYFVFLSFSFISSKFCSFFLSTEHFIGFGGFWFDSAASYASYRTRYFTVLMIRQERIWLRKKSWKLTFLFCGSPPYDQARVMIFFISITSSALFLRKQSSKRRQHSASGNIINYQAHSRLTTGNRTFETPRRKLRKNLSEGISFQNRMTLLLPLHPKGPTPKTVCC